MSDVEVEYRDITGPTTLKPPSYSKGVEVGVMYSFLYPLEDGSGHIEVCTAISSL